MNVFSRMFMTYNTPRSRLPHGVEKHVSKKYQTTPHCLLKND